MPKAINKDSAIANEVEVGSGVFDDGEFIELINAGKLKLLSWKKNRAEIGDHFKRDGITLVPPRLRNGLVLPPTAADPGLTAELISEVCEAFKTYSGCTDDDALILAGFSLCTWLGDLLERAPVVSITGLSPYTFTALEILQCVARRGLLLAAVNSNSLCTIDRRFENTLLLDHPSLTGNFYRVLRAASHRDSHLVRFGKILNIFGPVAICSECGINSDLNEEILEIAIAPEHPVSKGLEAADKKRLVENLQPRLLGFRFKYWKEVAQRQDLSITSVKNPIVRSIAKCLVGVPDLVQRLVSLVEDRMTEQTADSVQQVTLEALLAFSHLDREKVYIREIAIVANAICSARGEPAQLSARQVGTVVKHLGFRSIKIDQMDAA